MLSFCVSHLNVCNGHVNSGVLVDLFKLKLHMFATGPIGMVSALVQTNPEAMNAELADQDLEAVDELDKELREEGINVRFALLHNQLLIIQSS